ncbi:MAG TPA: methylated-DNA--[protein]-cysteine S-methyltransferase [Bacillota bacterium]|nr:methylated-DNA--[protein]-cysteine S-methyltransferase [Bacillota bacterium]
MSPGRYAVAGSPVGPLFIAVSSHGLSAVDFLLTGSLDERVAALRQHFPEHAWAPDTEGVCDRAGAELAGYFAGQLRAFSVPVVLRGTPFQMAVWQALRAIPHGQTRTYGHLAAAVGRSMGAARAAGAACGANPVAIVVPCHRVVGTDGSLTGFGGGLPAKRWLLRHEGALIA